MKPKKSKSKTTPVERLHDDYRRLIKNAKTEEEWIELQRTGGGAET
tara:strand:- start:22 stop:159 length:138 start_codon:yes stop_codon:yes gene_type:complete